MPLRLQGCSIRSARGPELYDLAPDMAEAHDVATQHPDIVRRLATIMTEINNPARLFADCEHPTHGKAEP